MAASVVLASSLIATIRTSLFLMCDAAGSHLEGVKAIFALDPIFLFAAHRCLPLGNGVLLTPQKRLGKVQRFLWTILAFFIGAFFLVGTIGAPSFSL
ncbi:hypothetical protein MarSH_254 [Marseillevirus Shanghai 1]|nr:hypothetical protein MarSH_254 [Marseillevirus Shanghai 1]